MGLHDVGGSGGRLLSAHSIGRLAAVALPMALSGCPALLSDDFRIVLSDGGMDALTDVRDVATSVEAMADDAPFDAGAEVASDATIDSSDAGPDVPSEDSTIDSVAIADAANADAADSADGLAQCTIVNHCADGLRDCDETGVDCGGVDCAPCQGGDAATADACTAIAPTPFGCGSTGYYLPMQYCVYRSGINGAPDTTTPLATPAACQCTGSYTCGCLLASSPSDQLCPPGETYINCQIGTTGGMVVGCK